MKTRSSWLGGVLAVLLFGVGCGGVQPLDAFKSRTFQIQIMPGPVTSTPASPGRAMIFVALLARGPSCDSLSPDVVATVNGDSNVRVDGGGCHFKGSSSPGLSYELDTGATAQNATIVLEDGTHRMEMEVQNLIADYRLQPQKAGFVPSDTSEEGVNPVARGEVLRFDRSPNLHPVDHFEATMDQERLIGQGPQREWIYYDVSPVLNGAEAQVTMPTANINDGMAHLGIQITEKPAILRCEGANSCGAEVWYGMGTNVTITP